MEQRKYSVSCMSNNTRTDYLKSLLKLKHQEDILERGLSNLIDNMKVDHDITANLSQEKQELSIKRQTMLNDLKKTLEEIRIDLNALKSILNDNLRIKTLDTNEFRSKLLRLSRKMENLKKDCPLPTFMEKNVALDSEIREFASQLHKYATTNVDLTRTPMTTRSLHQKNPWKSEDEDDEHITDFHELIAKTGHTQGWSDKDHLLFLQLRKKCKTIPALVTVMQTKCSDLTAGIVINHEAWYRMYQDLREKQKTKVKEWRKKREQLNKIKKAGKMDKNERVS